jgi:hypothetical protein
MSGGRASEFVNCEMSAEAGPRDVGPPSRTPASNPRLLPHHTSDFVFLLGINFTTTIFDNRPVSTMCLELE